LLGSIISALTEHDRRVLFISAVDVDAIQVSCLYLLLLDKLIGIHVKVGGALLIEVAQALHFLFEDVHRVEIILQTNDLLLEMAQVEFCIIYVLTEQCFLLGLIIAVVILAGHLCKAKSGLQNQGCTVGNVFLACGHDVLGKCRFFVWLKRIGNLARIQNEIHVVRARKVSILLRG